jgi:hypothetical protein
MGRLIGLAVFTFCLTAILVPVSWPHETMADLQILRLSRGSTASRAERACAVLLPTGFSVAKVDFTGALDSSKMTLMPIDGT